MDMEKDQELQAIQKQSSDVVTKAQKFLLDSDSQLELASQAISWINNSIKKIEERRKFFIKPLNDQVDKINDLFKGYSRPFKEARVLMNDKVLVYHRAQEIKRLEQEKKVREDAEKLAKKTKVSVEEIIASTPVLEVPKTIGTLNIQKRWTGEVVDPLKVPREYLMADEVKINKAVRDGVRAIAGVRIYEKEIISTR